MQQREKGECENSLLSDLEVEGDLAFFLVHALVGHSAEKHCVGSVIGVDGYTETSRDSEGTAIDADRLTESANDADRTGLGDDVYGLVGGQVRGDDNELVAAETREGVWGADGGAEVLRDVLKEFVADIMAVGVVDELETVEINHDEGG